MKAISYVYLALLVFGIVWLSACSSSGSSGTSPSPNIAVTVSPGNQTVDQGQTLSISASVANDAKNAGVTWSVSGAGSITNQTNISVTYSAPATVSAATSATVMATSVTDSTKSASLQVTVNAPPAVTTTSVPAATVGTAYSVTISATGGTSPYTWSVASGSLPSGLALSTSTGSTVTVVGTPTVASNSSTTIQVTDAAHASSSQALSFLVNAPKVVLDTTSLLGGVISEPYSQLLQASSGVPPYVWTTTSGSLPPGLILNASSGLISGPPTTLGTFTFVVKVTDTNTPNPSSATANLSITINGPLAVVTTSLASGSVGSAYAQTISVTGGVPPYLFNPVSGNAVPTGLTLNENGTITGTPSATGTSAFNFSVDDSQQPARNSVPGTLSITIAAQNCPNNANFTGNYAFLFNDGNLSNTGAIGSFVADGSGNIVSGLADPPTGNNAAPQAISGTYCIGSNNLGTLTLSYPHANATMAITIEADGNARLALLEGSSPQAIFSGVALKQNPTAFSLFSISGNYALGVVGGTPSGPRSAIIGGFTGDGLGNLSNGELVSLDDSPTAFTSTNFVVSSTGRGTATLSGPQPQLSLTFYIVDSSHLLAIFQSLTRLSPILLAGEIVKQTSSPYNNASLSGVNVFETQAAANLTSTQATVGLITFDGVGNFTLSADQNTSGTMTTVTSAGTYSVLSNGLVNLSVSGQPSTLSLWMFGPNQAFLGEARDTSGSFGIVEPQSGGPNFSTASFSGNYFGASSPAEFSASDEVDAVTADGAGNITGATDFIDVPGFPSLGTISGTYVIASNGRGTVTQNGSLSYVFYVVSSMKIVLLPTLLNPYLVTTSH